MQEQVPDHEATQRQEPSQTAYDSTGVEAVDQVLAAVASLDGRPVEEHVAVFERAHEQLRRALDAPGAH